MPIDREQTGRYYRSPSRTPAPVVRTGPGIFGIGSYRQGQRLSPVQAMGTGTPGSLLDMRLLEQFKGGGPDISGMVPQKSLLEQLIDAAMAMTQQAGGYSIGDADYEAQAKAEAAAQYDPQLAAIRSAMQGARRDTEYNKGGVESLYDALASTYAGDISESRQTYREARKSEKKISQEGSAAIQEGYQQAQSDLANVMQQLGIEEAAGAVLPGIAGDEATLLAEEAARSTAERSAYQRQGTAAEQYYEQGPSLAHMASAQGQQYLTEQLNKFLLDQRAQQAQLESQKQLTYNALLGKYRSEGAQNALEAQNTQFSQIQDVFNMIMAYQKFQQEGMQGLGGQGPTEGLLGSANTLGQLLGQSRGTTLQGDLMNFLEEEFSGEARTPTYPEALHMLREWSKDRGYSTMDLDALSKALAAYMNVLS